MKTVMLSQFDSCHLVETQQTIMATTVPLLLYHLIHISVHVQTARNNQKHWLLSSSNVNKRTGWGKRDNGESCSESLINANRLTSLCSVCDLFHHVHEDFHLKHKQMSAVCTQSIWIYIYCSVKLKNDNNYSEKNNVLGFWGAGRVHWLEQEGPAFNVQPGQGLSMWCFHIVLLPTVQRHAMYQLR